MAKRRPSGDGMVRKRDDGRWEGRIVVGHKENGASIFRYIYADTQKELSVKLRQYIDAYKGVDLTEESRMTLAEWLDRWLNEYMPGTVRPNTLDGYRRDMKNHVKPYLGQKPLARITATDIRRLYDTLKTSGRKQHDANRGPGLSPATVQGIHTTLHHALRTAAEAGLIPGNPADEVVPPKVEKAPKRILNSEQVDTFLSALESDTVWHDFFYTELTTGLRRGELCGLRWEDFDLKAGTLKIRRSIHAKKNGVLSAGDTKTYAGTRKIKLPTSTARLLRERKKSARTGWVFPNPLKPEEPTNPSTAYHHLKTLLKNAGLPDLRFHDLRHTFSTQALSNGVDAKTLAGILGHTKPSFTLDAYTHVTGEMQRNAAMIVGDFMTEILGEELKPWQNENPSAEAAVST